MSFENVDDFLNVLRRLELFAPEQIDDIQANLSTSFMAPRDLAEYLVECDWLTDYQVDRLFEGAWDDLRIDWYHLLETLGEGGVGQVFKAWDSQLGRIVALKVLRQELSEQDDAVRQFQAELRAIKRLNHPNVIKTFDANQMGRLHYLAMEYVEGIDLQHYLSRVGPLPIEQACEYTRQTAQGLQHSHQLGLVHRDIKPANIFLINPPKDPHNPTLGAKGSPLIKILDWGLARVLPKPGERSWADAALDPERGMLMGTADYLSPEQAQDASLVDTRGDLYSLGCTLYFLLTGRPPFPGGSVAQKLLRHLEGEPTPVSKYRSDVPQELIDIIKKMMAKNPEDRQQIPLLVVATLRHFCPGAAGSDKSLIRGTSGTHNGRVLRPPSNVNLKAT